MRLLVGMVFGCLLTVGGAYMHDTGSGMASERLVNWDVADRTFVGARETMQHGWDRLTGKPGLTSSDGPEHL